MKESGGKRKVKLEVWFQSIYILHRNKKKYEKLKHGNTDSQI